MTTIGAVGDHIWFITVQISTRELKANLSAVLRRVRNGEEISVTSHGAVVARLSPPAAVSLSAAEMLQQQPWAEMPGQVVSKLGLDTPVGWHGEGPSFTDLLLEDRE